MRIEAQPVARETDDQNRNRRNDRALPDGEKDREMKERPTSRPLSRGLGARDKSNNRVVEPKHPDLAQHIGRGPRDQEGAERRRAQEARDEEGENAAEIRSQKRDRVEEHSALQLGAGPVRPGAQFGGRKFSRCRHAIHETMATRPRGWVETIRPSCIS